MKHMLFLSVKMYLWQKILVGILWIFSFPDYIGGRATSRWSNLAVLEGGIILAQRATIRACLLPGLDQAVPMVEYFVASLEYFMANTMLDTKYCPCLPKVNLSQNTQGMSPGGLNGTSLINNKNSASTNPSPDYFPVWELIHLTELLIHDMKAQQSVKLQMKSSENINCRKWPFLPNEFKFCWRFSI